MTPIYINECFGMLHPAAGTHGVLVCGTLGDEALNIYRPLVHLAEQFAAAGSPALRLEYYGAGDSGGEDEEPGRFQAWLKSIAAGVHWLRENCGVGLVTLVGVRVGAVLAARAACDLHNIAALVGVAPLPSGRRFLREMTLRANTNAEIWQVPSHVEAGGWFEAHGIRLDRATRDALDQLDIAKLPRCPAPRALVLDQHDSPAGTITAERLQRLGCETTYLQVDGVAEMQRDPYENAVPHDAWARVVAWHAEQAAPNGSLAPGRDALASPKSVAGAAAVANALLTQSGQETPIRFGPGDSLFGILSAPAHPRDNAPPVLIANTGANPRSGNARSAATIARWLAANGIPSLRMDGAGTGDAALETGERGQPYSEQGDRDVIAGIDELSRRLNTPVLVLGMCSGAFHALRAAYDDHRIAGLMLVNLQKFVWQDGESLSVVQRRTFRTTRFYLRNVTNPLVWQRLLHGEVNIGGIGRALAGRLLRRLSAAGDPLLARLRRRETLIGYIRRRIHDLRRRRVPILFVLSGNDPGLDEIAEYFGANGRQFRRQPNVMFHMLEGADHTLSAHWAREALLGLIATFLRQRCSLMVEADSAAPQPARSVPARLDAAFVGPVAIDSPGGAA